MRSLIIEGKGGKKTCTQLPRQALIPYGNGSFLFLGKNKDKSKDEPSMEGSVVRF